VARDFEGHTDRDLVSTAFIARRDGSGMNLTTTTGLVHWKTFDETDLDYMPYPAATRSNDEKATQFTEEVRLSSSASSPFKVSSTATLAWQTGVFVFTDSYDQDAVNHLAPYALSPEVGFAVDSHSPQSSLDNAGVGVFGQGTLTVRERLDLLAGLRVDWESHDAILKSFLVPAIAPDNTVEGDRTFSSVSPQFAVSFRPRAGHSLYASVGKGFKAGGFNPASPPGSEEYTQEAAWHTEGGVKALLAGNRMSFSAAVFYIDWNDIQLNVPNPYVPAQFYIANAGAAASSGVEVEVQGRVHEMLSLFGAAGLTHARFKEDSTIAGVSLSDNKIPLTPDFTAMMGAEFSRGLTERASLFARAELVGYGGFEYDDRNTARQDAYMLTNLRAGVRRSRFFAEAWVRNAFDTKYVPVAFAYDQNSAPSGFLGEPGKPRTFGVRASVGF
jgi:iron complex outermembrane receptor protein